MSTIEVPRNSYVSAEDFRSRTIAGNDRDAVLYPDDNETLRWMLEQAHEWSQGGKPRILELGCGHGRWAKHLEGFYATYLGIDPVRERIESANRLFSTPHAEFMYEMSPLYRPTADRYGNPQVIFAVDVLQHLGLNEALGLVERAAMILPRGGRFVTWDGCIRRCTTTEAEAEYVDRPEHMIPKPLAEFEACIPSLRWTLAEGTRFVAVKV